MNHTIPKGRPVKVRTTNGGELTGSLLEAYRPTYDVVLGYGTTGSWVVIPKTRLEAVEEMET